MIDKLAKEYLHDDLRWVRTAVLWKLDGLSEYDIRRPLTTSGTNLLGLIKHLSTWEARYFGEVFSRPFPEPLPRWDDQHRGGSDSWATEHESRTEIIDQYRRVWDHADATIVALAIDARGHVPWWPRPDVTLFAAPSPQRQAQQRIRLMNRPARRTDPPARRPTAARRRAAVGRPWAWMCRIRGGRCSPRRAGLMVRPRRAVVVVGVGASGRSRVVGRTRGGR